MIKRLSDYEQVFINMVKNYVKRYPKYSFEISFDNYKQPVIGDSKQVIKAKFIDSANTFSRIFHQGSIGLGESYCEGKIIVKDSDYYYFLLIFVRTVYDKSLQAKLPLADKLKVIKAMAFSPFFSYKSQDKDINSHYSLDNWFDNDNDANEFYFYWLKNKYVQYTCAKWDESTPNLDEAQINKFQFYAKRLGISKKSCGKTMLDLGCGWGGLMFYFAEHYGVKCTGITLSTAQAKYIRDEIKKRKLEQLVNVENKNAHNMAGVYDYIISVGLLEHIDDYDDLFHQTKKCLKSDGKALFHAMFHEDKKDDPDAFMAKYIFPGGAVKNIFKAIKIAKKYFKIVDRNDLPAMSYPKTLAVWFSDFCKNENEIRKLLQEKSKCKDTSFAINIFKHYLVSARCGLTVNGKVCNILMHN